MRRYEAAVPPTTCCSLDFGGLEITYDERVLEPRPWTLLQSRWAEELSARLPEGPVLELCSGAGHIGLAAVSGTDRRLVQVDLNPAACELAAHNAAVAGLAERVEVRCGDLAEAVDEHERFPLVLADPPYLPSDELSLYPQDPTLAIDGGTDGLRVLHACVELLTRVLEQDGLALVQLLGEAQATTLRGQLPDGLELREVRSHDPRRAVALLGRAPTSHRQEHQEP